MKLYRQKPKIQSRPQGVGDTRNMEYILRRATGKEWNHHNTEDVRAAIFEVVGTRKPEPLQISFYHNVPWMLDMKLLDVAFPSLASALL